jgi:type II restriction enzyme
MYRRIFPFLRNLKGLRTSSARYDLLCQKLVKEQLYTTAALITSPRRASENGKFSQMSEMTGLRTFVAALAGHVAAEAARCR